MLSTMTLRRTLASCALAMMCAGCAGIVQLAGAPSLETTGNVGGEGALSVRAAAGDPHTRVLAGLTAGGGVLTRSRSAYAMLSPLVGASLGRDVQTTMDVYYAARFLFATPTLVRN